MLTGKELGQAIAAAIKKKGKPKAAIARHFGIKPPSISDWVKRGTIDKAKLEDLFSYFSDVVGPEHWGIKAGQALAVQKVVNQDCSQYNGNVTKIPLQEDADIKSVVAMMEATDSKGRSMALAAVKIALHGHKPAQANHAN